MSFAKSADQPSGNMVMLDPGRLEKLEEAAVSYPSYPRLTGIDASSVSAICVLFERCCLEFFFCRVGRF